MSVRQLKNYGPNHFPRESLRAAIHAVLFPVNPDSKEKDPDEFYPVPNRVEKRRRLRAFKRGGDWKSSRVLRKKRKPRTGGWK